MKNLNKRRATPVTTIQPLDRARLAAVTGGGLSGPDTPGVMEPVNSKHLTEWELIQDC